MSSTEQTAPDRIERELGKHARSIRRTQPAFAIFAVLELLLALGNLVTTASKLGTKDVGQSGKLSLRLKPGHYALICNQPGHYKAGRHTDFTVQ